MNFETWFNQQELYGLRSERFYDIAMLHRDNPTYAESLVAWLRASYEAGKEALAQPEQEPVAWITEWEGQYSSGKILDYIAHTRGGKVEYTPLYTTPPQRTWVGLMDIDYAGLPLEQVGLVRWAEAKLKEKNT